jgi:hemerythrin-like domain-containing protein
MLTEHKQCRMHIRTIAEHLDDANMGDTVARELVMEHGLMFHGLLTEHIHKEDSFLFTMADQLIRDDDLASLALSYDKAEAEPGYDETITNCRRIAQRLIERYDKP